MTHLVITGSLDGENVHWKEKVTDAEYSQANETKAPPVLLALNAKQQALVRVASYNFV